MTFKSKLQEDLDVFINENEFAEVITIDSHQIMGLISSVISEENKIKLGGNGGYGYGEGTYINEKEVSFKTDDMPNHYKNGDQVIINGIFYKVITVEEDIGMTTLIIGEQGN